MFLNSHLTCAIYMRYSQLNQTCSRQVDHDPKQHVLRVFGDLTERGHSFFPSLESLPVYLEVFIPLKYDVDILSHHHGRVSVKVDSFYRSKSLRFEFCRGFVTSPLPALK